MTTRSHAGLSTEVARARLAADGHNELPRRPARSLAVSVMHALAEPMFALLVVSAAIYLALGDRVEALFLLASVAAVIAITVYQQHKTERVLEALRDLSSPRALVVRDGVERRIAGREVVVDDVLLVREGDRVAADARLLEAIDLRVDESLLTGESMAVMKFPSTDAVTAVDARSTDVYAGSLVVKGHGTALVTATGARSEIGRIGGSLAALGVEATSLQAETRRLVRTFSLLALALCGALVIVYVVTRGDWLNGVLAGLTLAMAILPEEFPVVLTVFLALGAWRMTRVRVLTRRIAAIEALGAATVLCVDKTGTLTQNRMAVRRIYTHGQRHEIDAAERQALTEPFAEAVRISVLASEPNAFDPMERAFHELHPSPTPSLGELVHRYPVTSKRMAVTHVWRQDGASRVTIAAKGAPESIIDLCGMPGPEAEEVLQEASTMAESGLRVLAVAMAQRDLETLPDDPRAFGMQFVGLMGLADPLRPTVARAMGECRQAGVRVIMITGDFPVTARAIAREAGLASEPRLLTGADLDATSDAALRARLADVDVFARVVPAQKLRIVTALKAAGDVVVMTGDGVNDAPALKAASIGIAMGGRGTDVAREAAALVLLDDDFGSIVAAIRQGRRIFDNLRKAMSYLVAVHIPIAGVGLVPVLLGGPLVLFPAHVVFLEFVIDPACSIAFEAEPAEPDVMHRPPRSATARLLGGRSLVLAVLEGFIALTFTLGVYWTAIAAALPEPRVRLLAFTALFVANVSLIFFTRSGGRRVWRHIIAGNRSLWIILLVTIAAFVLIVAFPPLRAPFRMAAPTLADAQTMLVATLLLWCALAVLQLVHAALAGGNRRKNPRRPAARSSQGN